MLLKFFLVFLGIRVNPVAEVLTEIKHPVDDVPSVSTDVDHKKYPLQWLCFMGNPTIAF